jgi:hypothetical protein
MSTREKLIKARLGMLALAEELQNISLVCRKACISRSCVGWCIPGIASLINASKVRIQKRNVLRSKAFPYRSKCARWHHLLYRCGESKQSPSQKGLTTWTPPYTCP